MLFLLLTPRTFNRTRAHSLACAVVFVSFAFDGRGLVQADVIDIDASRANATQKLTGLKTAAKALYDGASKPSDRPESSVVTKLDALQLQLKDTVPKLNTALNAMDTWGRGLCDSDAATATAGKAVCDCASGDPAAGFDCAAVGTAWVDVCKVGGVVTVCSKKTAHTIGASSADLDAQVSGAQAAISSSRTELSTRPSSSELKAQMADLEKAAADGEPPAGALDALVDLEDALAKLPAADVKDWQRQVRPTLD